MKQRITLLLLGLLCAAVAMPSNALAGKKSAVKDKEGRSYYTAVNIWYEDPQEIMTTNYHRGQILPVNTKVTIESVGKKGIKFSDEANTAYLIQVVSKHTSAPIDAVFSNYFSESPVNLGRFSGLERKKIEEGAVAEGMSKDAVIVAYGYPPAHVTPSLTAGQWRYWKDRFRNFFVFFNKDGKVIRMGDE